MRENPGHHVGTVVGDAIGVVIAAGGDVEGKAALQLDDRGNSPTVDCIACDLVVKAKCGFEDRRDGHRFSLIIVRTLAVQIVVASIQGIVLGGVAGVAGEIHIQAL